MEEQTIKLTKGRWHAAFLTALSECGNVTEACKAANISRVTAYEHKKTDKGFAEEWEGALQQAADVLEREAWRRASEGVDEPQFYKGEICGFVRKYSDNLLMFLLKNLRPSYRERMVLSHGELDKMIEQALAEKRDKPEEMISGAVN